MGYISLHSELCVCKVQECAQCCGWLTQSRHPPMCVHVWAVFVNMCMCVNHVSVTMWVVYMVYVCMCIWIFTIMCMYVCVSVCARVHIHSEARGWDWHQLSFFITSVVFLDEGVSLKPEVTDWLSWSKPPSSCLYFPSVGISGVHFHAWLCAYVLSTDLGSYTSTAALY